MFSKLFLLRFLESRKPLNKTVLVVVPMSASSPRSRAVRLRLMSLTGTEIARLNDKAYRELLSARLEEERRINIARRIKEREVEEQNRQTKLFHTAAASSGSEDEAHAAAAAAAGTSGAVIIATADDMVPEQLKQYLCLDPEEKSSRKMNNNKPRAKVHAESEGQTAGNNGWIRTKSFSEPADGQQQRHPRSKSRRRDRRKSPAVRDPRATSAPGYNCRCRAADECPAARKLLTNARNTSSTSGTSAVSRSGQQSRSKKDDRFETTTNVRPEGEVLPHETHRLPNGSVVNDDLRGRLDAIQDLDTLYSLADRLLLPPLQFDEDAQEEEPMKLGILENAVFDGEVEENAEDSNEEFDDFTIF